MARTTLPGIACGLLALGLLAAPRPARGQTQLPADVERQEPYLSHGSCLVADTPNEKVWDYQLASLIYGDPNLASAEKIFTFGQCYGGGFIDDLAYVNGDRNRPRSNVVIATASEYFEPAWTPEDITRWDSYIGAWNRAVSTANTTMLDAFHSARKADIYGPVYTFAGQPARNWENPQYHASAGMDTATLGSKGVDHSYAVLFVGDADANSMKVATEQIYATLMNVYHYDPSHVKVLYTEAEPNRIPYYNSKPIPRRPGTRTELTSALASLGSDVQQLFFWADNHGGQYTRDADASFCVRKAATGQGGDLDGFEGHPGLGQPSPTAEVYNQSKNDAIYGAIGDIYLGSDCENTLTYDEEELDLHGDQIDAISSGRDRIPHDLTKHEIRYWFSIENNPYEGPPYEDGELGTEIRRQADRGEHPGDIYLSVGDPNKHELCMEESELGLFSRLETDDSISPWSDHNHLDDDDVCALEKDTPFDGLADEEVFFSLEGSWKIYRYGPGVTVLTALRWRAADGKTERDLEYGDLGIEDTTEDIDAMAMNLGGDGIFDMTEDWIIYSIARKPDETGGTELWQSYGDGVRYLRADYHDLGLGAYDDIDALDTVPEPTTTALLGLGACLALLRRRKRPRCARA